MYEVDINEIFSKLRNKTDIINFFRENNKSNKIFIAQYFPKEKSFNKEFLLGVIRGQKNYYPQDVLVDLDYPIILKAKD